MILFVLSAQSFPASHQKLCDCHLSNLAPLFSGRENVKVQRQPLPQTYKRAARQLRLALDTTVKVRNIRGKNKIEIEFSDDEELARLVGLLTQGDGLRED